MPGRDIDDGVGVQPVRKVVPSRRYSKVEAAAISEMVIVVDTREQRPFTFQDMNVRFEALPAGDYSIVGFQDRLAIERKNLGDFLSSIAHGRKRFQRELEKLSGYERACVVVEADYSHIAGGVHERSKMSPRAALATMSVIWTDYGVPVFTCYNRLHAQDFTLRVLIRFYLRKRGLK